LSGAVQWRSGHDGSDNNHYPNSDEHANRQKKESVLLLQRKDHFVQYVQISNGKQLWNVSLGNLVEPQRKVQATTSAEQQFLSNAAVEAELQQLFLEHAQLSAQNGKFGLMPMARAAKMQPAE
jgi:hypothetical protein